jgi:HK97 gp10 family phage protein
MIEVTGFEDIESIIQDMTLSDVEEKKIMKAAIQPTFEEVKSNTPVGDTKKMQESVKSQVTREDMGIVGKIIINDWATMFQEFGTSSQKHNVGFFERSVNSTTDEVVNLLSEGLLAKIK